MSIKDYKTESNYHVKNEALLIEYDNAVKNISEIMEDVSINGTPYGMKCFSAYQRFFDACCKEKKVVLDELKNWHQTLESYMQLFSYDKRTVEKLTVLSENFESFFETFSYMLEGLKEVKEGYDLRIEAYKATKGYLSPKSRQDMENDFKYTARFFVDLANQMEDFVDDVIKPKIDLCDIITSMELDFNEAIIAHKINSRLGAEEEFSDENIKL